MTQFTQKANVFYWREDQGYSWLKTDALTPFGLVPKFSLERGFITFFRNKFPGLFQDSNWFLQDSSHLPFQSQDHNSPYYLPYTSHFILEFNRFLDLFRASSLFPGLSSPEKCHNENTGLSKFFRTRMNSDESLNCNLLFTIKTVPCQHFNCKNWWNIELCCTNKVKPISFDEDKINTINIL